MSSRASLAIFPALLCLTYACGSNVVPAGPSSSASTTTTGMGGASVQNGGGPFTSAGAGGNVPQNTTVSATTTVSVGSGGAGGGSSLCTMQQQQARWAAMVQAPITLNPAKGANLDIAGPNGTGLTILQAQQIDCQCNDTPIMGTGGGGGSGGGSSDGGYCQWGDNGEVGAFYTGPMGLVSFINLWPGYLGSLSFKSRDGAHSYTIPIQTATIDKDGKNFNLDWNLAGFNENPEFDEEINEIHDALIATFAPSIPFDDDCQASQKCDVGNFGDVAYMYFEELGLGLWIASLSAGQPFCSTFNRMDLYPAGTPFSSPPP